MSPISVPEAQRRAEESYGDDAVAIPFTAGYGYLLGAPDEVNQAANEPPQRAGDALCVLDADNGDITWWPRFAAGDLEQVYCDGRRRSRSPQQIQDDYLASRPTRRAAASPAGEGHGTTRPRQGPRGNDASVTGRLVPHPTARHHPERAGTADEPADRRPRTTGTPP